MILNVEIYNNHIRQVKDFSLTVATLEKRLKDIGYAGVGKVKDPIVENLQLPPWAKVFYSYIFDNGINPTAETFIEEYFKQPYFEYLPNDKVEVNYDGKSIVVGMDGLVGRLYRAYPSLVRDLHFYLLLKESGHFSEVHYSFRNDYYGKVDVRVNYNGEWHNVGLMLSSKRSFDFWKKKKDRHDPIETIDIALNDCPKKRVGDYDLYTDNHIDRLLHIIKSK